METDDYLPLSGLQHLVFCERQCALIHVEHLWAENALTVEGRHLHEHVDQTHDERRGDVRVARGLWLRSDRLRVIGKADVVEFSADRAYPVEYKRGRRRRWLHDEIQLCAQAFCLEEMTGLPVTKGALYYGASRRRLEILFDARLRRATEDAALRFHELVRTRKVPPAILLPKCRSCSLRELCMPTVCDGAHSVAQYLRGCMSPRGEHDERA